MFILYLQASDHLGISSLPPLPPCNFDTADSCVDDMCLLNLFGDILLDFLLAVVYRVTIAYQGDPFKRRKSSNHQQHVH